MIRSFADKETERLFATGSGRRFPSDIQRRAMRRMYQLDAADSLEELRYPPSNRLEALARDRAGQWSIRINDQWRICFVWRNGEAWDAEIVDYH